VALSAGLVAVVACAMASVNLGIEGRLHATVGAADVRIRPAGSGKTMPESVLDAARGWPEVELAVGRLVAPLALNRTVRVPRADGRGMRTVRVFASTLASGEDAAHAFALRPLDLVEGRLPDGPGQIVLDELAIQKLSGRSLAILESDTTGHVSGATEQADVPGDADDEHVGLGVGDRITVSRLLHRPVDLTIVGVARQPPLGGRPQCFLLIDALGDLTGQRGRLSEVEIVIRNGLDPDRVVEAHQDDLDDGLILQTTEKVTSGLQKNIRSSQLGFLLATVLAFLSAAFIIMTGLTTNVAERQRELAILRCIGGTRRQLAASQLLVGSILGGLGAGIGVPAGVGLAALLVRGFQQWLPTGLVIPGGHLAVAAGGAVVSGLIGAMWPAWRAARVSPLRAMTVHAFPSRPGGILVLLGLGLFGLAIQAALIALPDSAQVIFWGYATVGLPAMFIGYFLLSVPMTILVVWLLAPVLSRVLRLPGRLLGRTIMASPYRHGFTAGAMMGGLALMVSIWTTGGSVLRDWLDKIEFPDAFVSGLALTKASQDRLDAMTDIIANTSAVTIHPVDVDAFGVRGIQQYKTSFIAFEPDRFFAMARLKWIQGDQETAIRRLKEGGAVIVAREFLVAQGLGLGDTFVCRDRGREFKFDIVGVVTSPGLDIISKFFNIGEEYTEQSIHGVLGSRKDLTEKFGSDAIHLIQIQFQPGVDDQAAVERIRRELFDAGILDAGSGKRIKKDITTFIGGSVVVFSMVAVAAMLVACFGVANLIVAGIEARQFEFGVLRAVGAQRGLLARLVIAEAIIIAITAGILGTLMGMQGSWAAQRQYQLLLGLLLDITPPVGRIAMGWGIVMLMTLGAATPAVLHLNRRRPRDLLAAMRG